jgi:hypothetical protein
VPWIALLDPDVTTTATDGLYVVYLYTADSDAVYLSMNQGATQHLRGAEAAGRTGVAAQRAALAEIASETRAIRSALGGLGNLGPAEISLGSGLFLPSAYEAGSIAAMRYRLIDLPDAVSLAADLTDFMLLYGRCVEIKDALAANRHVLTSARSERLRTEVLPSVPEFRPKSSADYFVQVSAATQRKTRKHEALVRAFGDAVIRRGNVAATNVHPRDMTVTAKSGEWLIEAKTVGLNAEQAVREALGQLFSYRHFYYRERGQADPELLALFSAPIGGAFEELLGSLGIQYLCRDGTTWTGSSDALEICE